MSLRRLAFFALLALAAPACAHLQPKATAASLSQATDTFFRFLRWGPDLRGAAQLLVQDSQRAWLERALNAREDRDLKVTEAELDDLKLRPDGTATTVTRLTWYRLPSVTTKTERVTLEWVDRDGVWYAAAIVGGPLPLSAPPLPPGAATAPAR